MTAIEEYLIITFESTNFAMQAESFFKASDKRHQIVPTPREITLSCGLSIKTSIDNYEWVIENIISSKIKNKGLYKCSGSGRDRVIEKISW
jgi:CRISPR/Cas system CMR-associated protein Cmr3 (group 5 of RAMP superfamily)